MFELKIDRAENGYVLKWTEEVEDGRFLDSTKVIEEDDSEEGEVYGMKNLLFAITDHFGVFGSKHSKTRVGVKVEHGYDYECKGCSICKED